MRVYEFSKESGIASKDLLELLAKNGFDVKSHMSVLSEAELAFLTKKLKKEPTISQVVSKKEEKAESLHTPKTTIKETTSVSEPQKQPLTATKKEPLMQPTVQPSNKSPHITPQVEPSKNALPVATASLVEKKSLDVPTTSATEITLEATPITAVAQKLDKPVNDLILTLLKWGVIANKNQILTEEVIKRIAEHYQIKTVKPVTKKQDISKGQITVTEGEFQERAPVVVVIGHVDHGKTTLLDFIRNTRVAAKEKGGITQHLGAYSAKTPQGNIVFLDTPGHEAFSKMRMRGIKAADVAILVIAADDGIMPQTIEAIKLAKNMEVPIIVAVNKIDKVDAQRLEIVKRQLSQHDLLPEEWGGQTVMVPISAKEGTNIDHLLEMILLQSQLMELKADISGSAKGYILEAKIEKGRGPVATLLSQHGNIKIGDYFVCGKVSGRVNSIVDSAGERLKEAGPSVPVQIAGFDQLPESGDYFEVVTKEQQRKPHAIEERKPVAARMASKENMINLIIKTDSDSSKEALLEAIEKLSKKTEKGFAIVHAAVGNLSESDVMLAANTGSRIITLHVKTDSTVAALAQRYKVAIDSYFIIYKLLEALDEMAQAAKEIKMIRKKIGEAGILRVFDIKNIGVIAGAYVKEGRFSKDGSVVVWRGNKKIGEGKIKSLQRDKKSVKEVHTGFECAFLVDGLTDWAQDDRVECFLEVPEGK